MVEMRKFIRRTGPRDCNHSPIAPDLPPNSIRSSDRLAS